jgi:hypothetical protein
MTRHCASVVQAERFVDVGRLPIREMPGARICLRLTVGGGFVANGELVANLDQRSRDDRQ